MEDAILHQREQADFSMEKLNQPKLIADYRGDGVFTDIIIKIMKHRP